MLRRITGATGITVPWHPYDDLGEPATLGGTPATVTASRRSDGAAVVAASVTADGAFWKATLNGADAPHPDILDVRFTTDTSAGVVEVEMVGGVYFTLADIKTSGWDVVGVGDDDRRQFARFVAVLEAERLCNRRFVPSYREAIVDVRASGDRTVLLPDVDIREIITAFDPDGEPYADVEVVDPGVGVVHRPSGFRRGRWSFRYRHGMSEPPLDVVGAIQQRWSHWLVNSETTIPERATSYSLESGTTYRLALATRRKTGYPEVDAVYARYRVPPVMFQ